MFPTPFSCPPGRPKLHRSAPAGSSCFSGSPKFLGTSRLWNRAYAPVTESQGHCRRLFARQSHRLTTVTRATGVLSSGAPSHHPLALGALPRPRGLPATASVPMQTPLFCELILVPSEPKVRVKAQSLKKCQAQRTQEKGALSLEGQNRGSPREAGSVGTRGLSKPLQDAGARGGGWAGRVCRPPPPPNFASPRFSQPNLLQHSANASREYNGECQRTTETRRRDLHPHGALGRARGSRLPPVVGRGPGEAGLGAACSCCFQDSLLAVSLWQLAWDVSRCGPLWLRLVWDSAR